MLKNYNKDIILFLVYLVTTKKSHLFSGFEALFHVQELS